jgi:hypothetical protein
MDDRWWQRSGSEQEQVDERAPHRVNDFPIDEYRTRMWFLSAPRGHKYFIFHMSRLINIHCCLLFFTNWQSTSTCRTRPPHHQINMNTMNIDHTWVGVEYQVAYAGESGYVCG